LGRAKYFLSALIAAIIWGFFSIFLREIKSYSASDILNYRIITSLVITWVLILTFRKKQLKNDIDYFKSESPVSRKKVFALIIVTGVLITCNWFTYIYAVNNVSLKSAAFAYMVCPLITALGGFLILKEHLSVLKFIGIGIALVSISFLAKGALTDVLWSVFIASFYAFYLIVQKVLNKIDKLNMLGIQLLISAILILPLFLYYFKSFPNDLSFWINIVIISVVFTILPLFLSLYALNGIPSSTVGIIIYINPIIAFAVAFFYFHEGINAIQILAYSLLLVAVIVFNWNLISQVSIRRSRNIDSSKIIG
jgi:chloramphenicol-sensitive protein RarD